MTKMRMTLLVLALLAVPILMGAIKNRNTNLSVFTGSGVIAQSATETLGRVSLHKTANHSVAWEFAGTNIDATVTVDVGLVANGVTKWFAAPHASATIAVTGTTATTGIAAVSLPVSELARLTVLNNDATDLTVTSLYLIRQ